MKVTVEREVGGRNLSLTTGEIAKQAAGAVLVQYGETTVFVAAQNGPSRPGTDFFPLTCDYRERSAAAGKFPGGFIKREGRPTLREVLTSRLTDRPIRPLFPEHYREEVQVMANVMSCDGVNDPDVLSIIGASTALTLSKNIPFQGPLAAVRVAMAGDDFILMPTQEQIAASPLDLVVAGTKKSILMIEGFADQLSEEVMGDALMFGHQAIVGLCELQEELAEKAGVPAKVIPETPVNPFVEIIKTDAGDAIRAAKSVKMKQERGEAISKVKAELKEKYFPNGADVYGDGLTLAQFSEAFSFLVWRAVRELTLGGQRLDGRGLTDLRPVSCSVGAIPRVHGSALFTRGETQSLCTVVLGTVRDEQKIDGIFPEYSKRFMLDYNFPPYSVGECRPIRGPGRREQGHGALAERSLAAVIPESEKFPYTIRVISDITESNGSSSMASVCSGTLGLMDAGVPIAQPVAGISIGLVKETDDQFVLLTDIIGDEDHYGDMDFKVAGTQRGVTGIQLDLKIDGINEKIIRQTLEQARTARVELLKTMLTAIRRPRKDISDHAPKLVRTKIDPAKIGLLIGPGGKTIRAIQEETQVTIDVTDDGVVVISGMNKQGVDDAVARVEAMAEEVKVGKVYNGTVTSIKDFGAFIEIAPGKDGLCHISELSDGYVKSVTDIVREGDKLQVKVIAVDDQNRVKLSRKAVMADLGLTDQVEGAPPREPRPEREPRGERGDREPRGERRDRGDRGDRGGDRGDRGGYREPREPRENRENRD